MQGSKSNKVLLLGLDGATLPILRPAFAAGHMPVLNRLLSEGASGILASTVPPYTPPGWTSIFTGVNPGKHGVFGFTVGNVQRPGGLVRLSHVKSPAIWNVANAQGAAVGLFNIPLTFPPPPIEGFVISGMLTPEEKTWLPDDFTYPRSLRDRISQRFGHYEIDIEVDYKRDWRSTEIIDRLTNNLSLKRRVLNDVLQQYGSVPILFVVLEALDRLLHMHYKFLDPNCELFHDSAARPIREHAWAFLDHMDRVISDLENWAGPNGFIVTMSDHGFGPKDKMLNVDLALREWGLLRMSRRGSMISPTAARRIVRLAREKLPRALWERIRSYGGDVIDWSRTKAFMGPYSQQGIFLNIERREPFGIVTPSSVGETRAEIIERFQQLRDPDDGHAVLDHIHLREEVLQGPHAQHSPDLFPICRAYSYELTSGLHRPSLFEDWRHLPHGFHHMDGVFGIHGPGISAKTDLHANVYDITPTALYLAGLKLPPTDGRVLVECLPSKMLSDRPIITEKMDLPDAGLAAAGRPYSPDEEREIERSLRNLGYL